MIGYREDRFGCKVYYTSFIKLFERYGYHVEEFVKKFDDGDCCVSYIASNDTFFIPFGSSTVTWDRERNIDEVSEICAVSYLIEDKDAFIAKWKAYNEPFTSYYCDASYFAYLFAWEKHDFIHYGNFCGKDYTLEITERLLQFLASLAERR